MTNGLQLFSKVTEDNTLELSLAEVEIPNPGPKEVVIRVDATPLNPSDQATLFGPADLSTARASGTTERPIFTADIPRGLMPRVATRVGKAAPVGMEGAGVVIAAGEAPEAQALLGKMVTGAFGGMYAQYRCVHVSQCMPMPEGVTAKQAASSFVNPMTALSMVENMRMDGHSAIVHTAAASNLGQMLNRICQADGIELVNIVRKPEQEEILRNLGAKYIVNSTSETFTKDLTKACAETGATIAFDAIGGGELADKILTCMERAAASKMKRYDHYGSTVMKQIYIYGGLDLSPVVLKRGFGFAWNVSGWLLTNFMTRAGQEVVMKMAGRVAAEINTTFASHYTREVSLAEALSLDAIAGYSKQATGEKYLITPQK